VFVDQKEINETWLIIKGVLFDSLLFALLWLYFTVLPKNRPGWTV